MTPGIIWLSSHSVPENLYALYSGLVINVVRHTIACTNIYKLSSRSSKIQLVQTESRTYICLYTVFGFVQIPPELSSHFCKHLYAVFISISIQAQPYRRTANLPDIVPQLNDSLSLLQPHTQRFQHPTNQLYDIPTRSLSRESKSRKARFWRDCVPSQPNSRA